MDGWDALPSDDGWNHGHRQSHSTTGFLVEKAEEACDDAGIQLLCRAMYQVSCAASVIQAAWRAYRARRPCDTQLQRDKWVWDAPRLQAQPLGSWKPSNAPSGSFFGAFARLDWADRSEALWRAAEYLKEKRWWQPGRFDEGQLRELLKREAGWKGAVGAIPSGFGAFTAMNWSSVDEPRERRISVPRHQPAKVSAPSTTPYRAAQGQFGSGASTPVLSARPHHHAPRQTADRTSSAEVAPPSPTQPRPSANATSGLASRRLGAAEEPLRRHSAEEAAAAVTSFGAQRPPSLVVAPQLRDVGKAQQPTGPMMGATTRMRPGRISKRHNWRSSCPPVPPIERTGVPGVNGAQWHAKPITTWAIPYGDRYGCGEHTTFKELNNGHSHGHADGTEVNGVQGPR
eukprot:jgi/Tetstr1/438499/TSEL_027054.t1